MISLWSFGYPMVIFLGGLQTVPRELYEAAHIDGAGRVGAFPACHAAADLARDVLQSSSWA
jgi:ABC-type polysaccharide transport system permease subunit